MTGGVQLFNVAHKKVVFSAPDSLAGFVRSIHFYRSAETPKAYLALWIVENKEEEAIYSFK